MYVFLDLETTGLDRRYADILEIGIVVANDHFAPIDDFEAVIKWDGEIGYLDPIVQDMHAKTGLWEKVKTGIPLKLAEDMACEFLFECYEEGILEKGKFEMCGNTISFDRGMLQANMPRLLDQFHYRNVDVSSLKVLTKKYGHPGFVPNEPDFSNQHMALSDCYDSLRELEYYTKLFGISK